MSSARLSVGLKQVISPPLAWLSSSLVMLEDTRGARGLILYTFTFHVHWPGLGVDLGLKYCHPLLTTTDPDWVWTSDWTTGTKH